MPPVTISIAGDIAWVTIDNPPVNATSTAVRAGLLKAVAKVQGCRLAVLRGVGRTFVVGGDMSEFDRPPEEPHLPDVVAAIEASATPFLALLHGSVLGGGFEIAMGCAWRIAAPGTRFGLPEVHVGLVPGAGGTQRAPRLIGWAASVDMACRGRVLDAAEMLELGGIDGIEADLDAAARVFDASRPDAVAAREVPPLDPDWAEETRRAIAARAKGQAAPLHAFKALTWAALPFSEGQPKERALHLDLRQSDQSRALRHAFFAERAVGNPAALQRGMASDIAQITVVGGGLMGAGIAVACLGAGLRVSLIERDGDAAAAQDRVAGQLASALKRGKIGQKAHDAQLAAFSTATDYQAASGADLAIEAVFEDLSAKRAVFVDLDITMRPDTLLATNTSYLDPHDIFEGVSNQTRCLGLHFFAPAHIMKLLEVVRLPETSPDTLATAFALAKRLRKVPVLSGICDGFIGNRMLAAYRRAVEYMLADGALPWEVDAAMRTYGMAMGPFEAQDISGLQIAEANRRRQDATRDRRERYVPISDRICAAGRLGQRAGQGWYRYAEGRRDPQPDPDVETLIRAYSAEQGLVRQTFSTEDIQTRVLAVLANEGARIVEDGIAESEATVDMVQIHGYGFPRWRGGPMHTAEAMGDAAIKTALDALEADSPDSWIRARRYSSTKGPTP